MGVADRTLKTFDYISKGLLPLDDFLCSGGEALEEQILDREKSGKKADGQKKRGEEGPIKLRCEDSQWTRKRKS